ncbi:MAG TPA: tRNA (adenosine(37)-N6)-threonylcarbamoyltransferase complex dimerization subunit type 1 TsaB [bacterium]|nr:tRNA (adenosine(37)-N6)-threonylcarbamoyltransferase complex dimerization subunit type 1 TsaB [bacterium]HPT29623.1 tRNA (adenosine(37)-N6)-threonylcarbamoyltransferase complex dimerization subunit type 1 TsaB [bacterium]
MTLYISTAHQEEIKLALIKQGKIIFSREFSAPRLQSEKLLPEIDRLLKKAKLKLKDLKKIKIADGGGSFTSLRIGVLTANALAYALGIPIETESGAQPKKKQGVMVAEPQYDRGPNIG